MNRRSALSISGFTVAGIVLRPGTALPQQKSLKEKLIGTWTYVSSTAKLPDGSPLWGANPKSLMLFSDSGHFSWHVFRSDRPKFASNDRLHATADENKATLQGSLAYFGTYSVSEADKTVSFHIGGSTFPNSEGEELKRVITGLTADELKYTNPATTLGARVDAIWKRVN